MLLIKGFQRARSDITTVDQSTSNQWPGMIVCPACVDNPATSFVFVFVFVWPGKIVRPACADYPAMSFVFVY